MRVPLYARRDQLGSLVFDIIESNGGITYDPVTKKITFGSLGGGASFISGATAPDNSIGEDGDTYYDYVAKNIYSPKAEGEWPDGESLVGPSGTAGIFTGPGGTIGPEFLPDTDLTEVLYAENATTVELSDAELDTAYEDAEPPFMVLCAEIATGGLAYIKTTTAWEAIPLSQAIGKLATANVWTGNVNEFQQIVAKIVTILPDSGSYPSAIHDNGFVRINESATHFTYLSGLFLALGFGGFLNKIAFSDPTADSTVTVPNITGNLLVDKTPGVGRVVLSSTAPVSHTGNTTETTIYTGTIPGPAVGASGSFEIMYYPTTPNNNANAKTSKIKFNGVTVGQINLTNAMNGRYLFTILNTSQTSQKFEPLGTTAGIGLGNTGSSPMVTSAINTGADITVTITIQLGLGTESAGYEAFTIKAFF